MSDRFATVEIPLNWSDSPCYVGGRVARGETDTIYGRVGVSLLGFPAGDPGLPQAGGRFRPGTEARGQAWVSGCDWTPASPARTPIGSTTATVDLVRSPRYPVLDDRFLGYSFD